MNISLTAVASEDVSRNIIDAINEINNKFDQIVTNNDFGDGVKSIIIGIICVSPEFDFFFKTRRKRFVVGPKTIKDRLISGKSYVIERQLTFEIKLHHETYRNLTIPDAVNRIINEIVTVFPVVEKKYNFNHSGLINAIKSMA